MRFLIAEDDATLAEAVSQALRQQAFTVDIASSGTVALHALRHEHVTMSDYVRAWNALQTEQAEARVRASAANWKAPSMQPPRDWRVRLGLNGEVSDL